MNSKNDVARLAYELTYHKYLLNKDKAKGLFTELDISEFIALHGIKRVSDDKCDNSDRTYLKDLAEQLEITIYSASKMVSRLKERGFVLWSHDGAGDEGTYVVITDSGISAMRRQEELLNAYYSRVIEEFGHDNMLSLLQQLERLEYVMNNDFYGKGDSAVEKSPVE